MKVCPKCGEEYRDTVKTCSDCGVKLVNYEDSGYEENYNRDEYDLEGSEKKEKPSYKVLNITTAIIFVFFIILRIILMFIGITETTEKSQVLTLVLECIFNCLIAFGVLTFISALCDFFEDIHLIRLQVLRRK